MEFTKDELEKLKRDPLMEFLARLCGTSMDELVESVEKDCNKSCTDEAKVKEEPSDFNDDNKEIGKKIKRFFDKMVEDGKATATIEDGHPHYSIKTENDYKESENQDALLEESGTSFSMSKEELGEFIRNYTKLENTFRKLEHTFGIDLNANGDSIYAQYNNIVWNLIESIFGEDNREDIADFCFGDSNFDTVDDLYEELV